MSYILDQGNRWSSHSKISSCQQRIWVGTLVIFFPANPISKSPSGLDHEN